ncbi:hypothetical protein [Intestinibacter sp.]|uniref:hypothetical protein n=1 Tax=Intestinibacter sp. TaxID=1965304 RepID=UPI003F15C25F
MKKAIISIISILCVGLMVVGPIKESYATDLNDTKSEQEVVEATNQKQQVKEETNEDKALTKSEALQLVKDFEPSLDYDYMGDENTYECIKENGIKGYVFLPQCEGDMAYLVDKETGNIYFFHPSGYFELLK